MTMIDELKTKALAGDATAQYRLAAALDEAGDAAGARSWTQKAAAAGHPGALFTEATHLLAEPPDTMDASRAAEMLEQAAAANGPAAMRQLAALSLLGLGTAPDEQRAIELILRAATLGHPAAMREVGALCVLGGDEVTGAAYLRASAARGDWIAGYLALARDDVLSTEERKATRSALLRGGVPLIDRFNATASSKAATANPEQARARAAINTALEIELPAARALHQAPDIEVRDGALPAIACDYLISMAAGLLQRSRVVNSTKAHSEHAGYRTSEEAMFSLLDLDLMMLAIYRLLAKAAGVANANCELMGVLRYHPGQEYKPHHDYLPEDAADYSQVRRSGQRSRTVLLALNDGFEGGETRFPRLDIAWRGAPGDILVFHNTDAQGRPFPQTLHAGAPVISGEKWLLTLWCRERAFWFWDQP